MITTKKQLNFYIMADMMMNRGRFSWTIKDKLKNIIMPDYVMDYLKFMRMYNYYNNAKPTFYNRILRTYSMLRFTKLGLKLGFSIGPNVFGYGLTINHYGTIVVGWSNRIGKYSVIHT